MEQRNKKIAKLKHKVGKLKNTIEFLKAENEKQHKEHFVKLLNSVWGVPREYCKHKVTNVAVILI